MRVFMGFINKYLYNNRVIKLKGRLDEFRSDEGVECQTAKLTKMKNGDPVYLIPYTSSEDGQVYVGGINVLTVKGFDRGLNYLVVTNEFKYIKIGAIKHDTINQGIGTQLLIMLDEIAQQVGIHKITGWLSPLDLETHRERLLHFCDKNGYQLTPGENSNMNIEGFIYTKYL
jgi:GNAT superfamily N-acetyltransferase